MYLHSSTTSETLSSPGHMATATCQHRLPLRTSTTQSTTQHNQDKPTNDSGARAACTVGGTVAAQRGFQQGASTGSASARVCLPSRPPGRRAHATHPQNAARPPATPPRYTQKRYTSPRYTPTQPCQQSTCASSLPAHMLATHPCHTPAVPCLNHHDACDVIGRAAIHMCLRLACATGMQHQTTGLHTQPGAVSATATPNSRPF